MQTEARGLCAEMVSGAWQNTYMTMGLQIKPSHVDTKSGIKYLDLTVRDGKAVEIKVNMGSPVLETEKIPMKYPQSPVISKPLNVEENIYEVTAVSMGNPHAVVFMEDIQNLDLEKVGPGFEKHMAFPESVNTEFVHVLDPQYRRNAGCGREERRNSGMWHRSLCSGSCLCVKRIYPGAGNSKTAGR